MTGCNDEGDKEFYRYIVDCDSLGIRERKKEQMEKTKDRNKRKVVTRERAKQKPTMQPIIGNIYPAIVATKETIWELING